MSGWASPEELVAAAKVYGRTWWRNNDAALEVICDQDANPGLAEELLTRSATERITTTDVYVTGYDEAEAPIYRSARSRLHEDIISACVPYAPLSGTTAHDNLGGEAGSIEAAEPQGHIENAGPQPTAYFTIGGPGTGKSTYLRSRVQDHRVQAVVAQGLRVLAPCSLIDADTVREILPEYGAGLGSLVVGEESYALTYGPLFDAALERGYDLIYDTIGRAGSFDAYLERLVAAGYRIHALHASAPPSTCQARADRRALEENGRTVDGDFIRRAVDDCALTLDALVAAGRLDGWAKYDTTDLAKPKFIDGTDDWRAIPVTP